MMGRWRNVPMFVIAEPTVAEVTGWLAAPNVFVVIHKMGSSSTECVRDLQFSMHSGYNGFSRSKTSTDLAVRREVEVNNSVKCGLELHWILGRGIPADRTHKLIRAHGCVTKRHLGALVL